MAYEFILAVDTEDKANQVTLAIIERAQYETEQVTSFHLRLLEQRAGDEQALVQHIQNVMGGVPYVGRSRVIVNRTERTGRRLLEGLTKTGISPIGVTLTNGDAAAQSGPGIKTNVRRSQSNEGGFIVSAHDILQATLDLYGAGQLNLEQDFPEVTALAGGLQNLMDNAPDAGAGLEHIDAPVRREMPHSGVLFATALACWYGSQLSFSPADEYDEIPIREAVKSAARPDTTTRV